MTSPRSTYGGGYYSAPSFPDTPIYDSLVAERGTPQIAPIRVPAAYDTGSSYLPALPRRCPPFRRPPPSPPTAIRSDTADAAARPAAAGARAVHPAAGRPHRAATRPAAAAAAPGGPHRLRGDAPAAARPARAAPPYEDPYNRTSTRAGGY